MRLITMSELRAALRLEDLIEPVAEAFVAFSRGQAVSELIVMFPGAEPSDGDVYVKTGTIAGARSYVVKVSPWFASNANALRPQGGLVAVFDASTGYTQAILDDQHLLTDLRTAAAGAIAARHLAPKNPRTALVVGTGAQAFWQPQALARERSVEQLLVWGRDPQRAERLAVRLRTVRPVVATSVVVAADLQTAVENSDVILMATSAREPVLAGDWLHAGQHITSVGSDDHTKAELDAACLRRADRLIVDSIAAAHANGNVHRHLGNGAIAPADITGELGEVLAGSIPGRESDQELTVATLIGLGAQDLAAASGALRALTPDSRTDG